MARKTARESGSGAGKTAKESTTGAGRSAKESTTGTGKPAKTKTAPKDALAGDFFGFEEIPFDEYDFRRVQTDIFQKVERALLSMEEDLHDKKPKERELLSSVMKLDAWRNLRECLGASIQSISKRDELEKYILECANIFYKELDHPYWSTTQFQYLLHLNPSHPDYWAGYGICLVKMQERGMWEEFNLEDKASIAFKRAARLCLAHLWNKTSLYEKFSFQKLLDRAGRYYENAQALNPEGESEQGLRLLEKISGEKKLLEKGAIEKEISGKSAEAEEISKILALRLQEIKSH